MNKQFGGFTTQQMEVLARKMGFNGPMHKFNEFVSSSPEYSAKLAAYTEKARSMVEGVKMAEGGSVSDPTELPKTVPTMNSLGSTVTNTMITKPETYVDKVEVDKLQGTASQMVPTNSGQVGPANVAQKDPRMQNAAATVSAPDPMQANTVDTATVTPQTDQALQDVEAAKGTVSQQSQVDAIVGDPSQKATVQGQLASLMQQFDGGETPAWAAGAIRKANAIMGQRGLGASSMAAMATTQAAMESALEIAVRDAATYSTFELANLDRRQQAALQNAQSFLAMDLKNLDNEQQTVMFKAQARIQALFSDQAAENASRQFNATSKNQTDQFFANLSSQVKQFNASQINAMQQFKIGESNKINMFNAEVRNQRDQFNAANRLIIDQSNAQWRRQIATINNEATNEANRVNAQLSTGMTMAAYNNLMQRERDMYSFAFTAGENAADRATRLLEAQLQIKAGKSSALGEALGTVAGIAADNLFSKWFS